jgi:hypothetical protein
VPLLPPRIGVARADPGVARRVRAEEEAAERERLERDRELEKEMRELHSGVGNRRALAGVETSNAPEYRRYRDERPSAC